LGCIGFTGWDFREIRRKTGDFAEVIHVHDSYEAISPLTIGLFSKLAPVLHTMHDTSSFTGGCINPMGCERYRRGCGHCPQREVLGRFDLTAMNFAIRRKVYANPRISCAFPSAWMLREASSSLSLGRRARLIPNGFDAVAHNFRPRAEARKILGIPQNSVVLCAGAHTVSSAHKGFGFVVDAVTLNKDVDLHLILLGHVRPEATATLDGLRVTMPGFVSQKERLALYYSAADLMLFPSMGDNLPIMIQESMYAQTPVLAFATGGIPELIDDEINGWLVPTGDGQAFTRKLRSLLSDRNALVQAGLRAQEKITRSFNMSDCVQRYAETYEQMIALSRASQHQA